MNRPVFAGYLLNDPRLTRLLDQQLADNARIDAAEADRIAANNEQILCHAVEDWLRGKTTQPIEEDAL